MAIGPPWPQFGPPDASVTYRRYLVSWIDGQSSRCTIDKLADLAKELPAAPLDAPKWHFLLTVMADGVDDEDAVDDGDALFHPAVKNCHHRRTRVPKLDF